MNFLFFEKISDSARMPTKFSERMSGFHLFSAHNYIIRKNSREKIYTDLIITMPNENYGIVVIDPELASKYFVNSIGQTIENDSNENVGITIINHENKDIIINEGDCIGILILEKIINVESFEIFRHPNKVDQKSESEIFEKDESKNEKGHDVIDRLGCQIPNCKHCYN